MERRAKRWFGAAAGALLLLLLGAHWMGRNDRSSNDPPPSDDELRRRWSAHRAELDELRSLIAGDSPLRVVGDDRVSGCWLGVDRKWGCPAADGLDESGMLAQVGLARERYASYRKLLASVGAHRAERGDDCRVRVTMYGAGIVSSGVTKDLVWSPTPISPLVADTDRARSPGYRVSHSSLDGGWYIEHSSN